jgi:hypothetical protein
MTDEIMVGNVLAHHPEIGYFLTVFDHRQETLEYMERNGLQGGGPTWTALITAALLLESPATLSAISFDDEADEVVVISRSEAHLKVVQTYVSIIMTDSDFMNNCVQKARGGSYLE